MKEGGTLRIFIRSLMEVTTPFYIHFKWQSVDGPMQSSGADLSGIQGHSTPQVCTATWMAGTRNLALMDSFGCLGVVEHTGKLIQLELRTWVR